MIINTPNEIAKIASANLPAMTDRTPPTIQIKPKTHIAR